MKNMAITKVIWQTKEMLIGADMESLRLKHIRPLPMNIPRSHPLIACVV